VAANVSDERIIGLHLKPSRFELPDRSFLLCPVPVLVLVLVSLDRVVDQISFHSAIQGTKIFSSVPSDVCVSLFHIIQYLLRWVPFFN
jgi:hypothetical protein